MRQLNNASSFCRKAIAYLKPSVPEAVDFISLSERDSPVLHDLNNGLLVSYVVDEGSSFSYVQNRHIEAAKIDLLQLHEYGVENLRQLAEEKLKVQEYGPVYAVFLDGNFEASLILLDELWNQRLSQLISGQFAVVLPARDVLAFCDASSSEGLAELKRIASRVAEGDHLLSSSLYRRQQSEWVPYVP